MIRHDSPSQRTQATTLCLSASMNEFGPSRTREAGWPGKENSSHQGDSTNESIPLLDDSDRSGRLRPASGFRDSACHDRADSVAEVSVFGTQPLRTSLSGPDFLCCKSQRFINPYRVRENSPAYRPFLCGRRAATCAAGFATLPSRHGIPKAVHKVSNRF